VEPSAPPAIKRRRGNPNWGSRVPPAPAAPTAFEMKVRELHLTPETYASSTELRLWCEQNKNHHYIPEWLLKKWRLIVDSDYITAA